jgi:hypothetical protein
MLCGLCRRASRDALLGDPRLVNWWEAHERADIRRREQEEAQKEREKMRQEAKAKLTAMEREILGIRD